MSSERSSHPKCSHLSHRSSRRSSQRSSHRSQRDKLQAELDYLKEKEALAKQERELKGKQQELEAKRQITEKENDLKELEESMYDEETSQVTNEILDSLPEESESEKIERLYNSNEIMTAPSANVDSHSNSHAQDVQETTPTANVPHQTTLVTQNQPNTSCNTTVSNTNEIQNSMGTTPKSNISCQNSHDPQDKDITTNASHWNRYSPSPQGYNPYSYNFAPQKYPSQLEQNSYHACNHDNPNDRPYSSPYNNPQQYYMPRPNQTDHTLQVTDNLQLFARSLLRMKPLNIKKFDGNPDKFAQFQARFAALEEDQCYSRKELLQILLDSVEGRAEQALKGYMPGSDRYAEAMDTLKLRFGQTSQVILANETKLKDHPKVDKRNPSSMRSITDTLSAIISTYHSLNLKAELASGSNVIQILEKLPMDLRLKWERDMSSKPSRPTLEDLYNWLERETTIIEKVYTTFRAEEKFTDTKRKGTTMVSTEQKTVPLCILHPNGKHYTRKCEKLKTMPSQERVDTIKENKLCWLCLKPRHGKCRYNVTCETCSGKHHVLAHEIILQYKRSRETNKPTPESTTTTTKPTQGSNHQSYTAKMSSDERITNLPLVNIQVSGPKGVKKTVALLDTGSEITFMSTTLSKTVGLTGPQKTIIVGGINSEGEENVTEVTNVKITSSKARRKQSYSLETVLVKKPGTFPKFNNHINWSIEKYNYQHLANLPIPDTTGTVEMIIGCDHGYLIRPLEVKENTYQDPIAMNTRLGWTVISTANVSGYRSSVSMLATETTTQHLDKQLTEWFNLEMEPLTQQQPKNPEDTAASQILTTQTIKLDTESRYEVPILWKDSAEPLPNNKQQAESQWLQLEKRLDKDEKMKSAYIKTLHTDLEKGFIKEVSDEEKNQPNQREHYIVHHPVVHPHKPDKVRRVYNFSSKYEGQSLNDRIHNGPDLLNSLTGVLTRFRTGNICLASDISDMFLQMKVKEEDENSLRFLFRENQDQPIQIYKCVRRPLGERSAPCCANYTIKRCCEDNKAEFPLAAEIADSNFYVDDCLTSVNDKDQAIQLSKDLTSLLAQGSFKLTKWMSNCNEVLETIPAEEQYKGLKSFNDEVTSRTRTLGAVYDPTKDCFITTISQKDPASTPREFLSRIASIWDPLGHLSPFIIRGRDLQRETFEQKLHWDSLVTDPLLTKWRSWEEELLEIQGTEIPRPFRTREEVGESSLVSFSDASKMAKCAVNYIRTKYQDDKVDTRINVARTKLSPQKTISIPRLELDAFLMSVRLVKSTLKELNIPITTITFFTDSMIVLYWIKQPSNKYRDYVAHRISDIKSELKHIQDQGYKVEIRHCPTAENPADDGTRGLTPDRLGPQSRWQLGPPFLRNKESTWPTVPHEEEKIEQSNLEVRKKCLITRCTDTCTTPPAFEVKRFSTLSKAVRVLARCLRWKTKESGPLSCDELTNSEILLIKIHQKQVFGSDLKDLKLGKDVSSHSRIKRLVPFLDENGIIRVKGRLRHATIPYSAKHPIIIDGNSPLAELIVRQMHLHTKHGSVNQVLNELRQTYWILKAKQVVKKYTWNCWFCKKERAKPSQSLMADLPNVRVTPNNTPFTSVMCDYFGPITVKDKVTTRRSIPQKRWGCIFTCLATRAVHLELATDLSTNAFINCLIRFTSRRGTCKDIYSDRGTNFIGADAEIQKNLDIDQITNSMHNRGINWHFGSPLSPHKTGAVERMVRSVKRGLRSLQESTYKSDVLHTALVDIEGALNSRPLTELPVTEENPNELRAITPNDLLLLKPDVGMPLKVNEKDGNSRKLYKQALAIGKTFWSRWLKEYIPTLQSRSKWFFETQEPKVGELVLSIEDGVSKHQWPLARIVRVIRSDDQRIRTVVLKMKNGEYTRPLVKICRLED